jgi:hypothetical protein
MVIKGYRGTPSHQWMSNTLYVVFLLNCKNAMKVYYINEKARPSDCLYSRSLEFCQCVVTRFSSKIAINSLRTEVF